MGISNDYSLNRTFVAQQSVNFANAVCARMDERKL